MNQQTILAVLPTIRNLDNCLEWAQVFQKHKVHFLVIQDGTDIDINIPGEFYKSCKSVYHLRWHHIDQVLGQNSWIISRKDSAIRCFGWLWAKLNNMEFDYVFTFDDDTKPLSTEHLSDHIRNCNRTIKTQMFNTIPNFLFNSELEPRGFIGKKEKVYISHGLWTNVPDIDGTIQKSLDGILKWNIPEFVQEVPKGVLYPMCGMNLFFRAEIAPAMYFGLMGTQPNGESWGIGRWDDMFAGWLSKLWIDKIDGGVISGHPFCNHQRASNVQSNILKEQLWYNSAELSEILETATKIAEEIQAETFSVFLEELTAQLYSKFQSELNAVKHFFKCLESFIVFTKYFK